jgi:hypothetical protein
VSEWVATSAVVPDGRQKIVDGVELRERFDARRT